jgi:hypothetical protein
MNSKQKGKVGELALAKYLREHGFDEARRGQQFRGGSDSPDCVGVPGVHLECKYMASLQLHDAYAQACRDAAPGAIPTVAFKQVSKATQAPGKAKPWMAILSLDDYLLSVREVLALRREVETLRNMLETGQ